MRSESDGESFEDAARAFCDWTESEPESSEHELETAIALLSQLYSSTISLPSNNDWDYPEFEGLTHEDWKRAHKRFGTMPFQFYNSFFEPTKLDNVEAVMGDVCDDLADIYRDLKDGFLLAEVAGIENAQKYWQAHFSIHWGRHATGALNAMECFRSSHDE